MSETKPVKPSGAKTVPAWVRYFVDYAGLLVFLITLVATKSAITASWAIVGGSILALAVGLIMERRLAPMPLVTAVLGLIFGGLTLFFHDERFIKVKPTILYTAFGLFLITGALRGKNPLKVLMGDAFHLPDPVIRAHCAVRSVLFRPGAGQRGGVAHADDGVLGLLQVSGRTDPDLSVRHEPGAADDEAHARRRC